MANLQWCQHLSSAPLPGQSYLNAGEEHTWHLDAPTAPASNDSEMSVLLMMRRVPVLWALIPNLHINTGMKVRTPCSTVELRTLLACMCLGLASCGDC